MQENNSIMGKKIIGPLCAARPLILAVILTVRITLTINGFARQRA